MRMPVYPFFCYSIAMSGYLELIQLTKLFLMQETIKKATPPIQDRVLPSSPIKTPSQVIQPQSLPRKEETIQTPIPIIRKKEDLSEMESLIKEHLPNYKLRKKVEAHILILTHEQTTEELKLLSNIAGALNKKGFITDLTPIESFTFSPHYRALIVERKALKSATHLHSKIRKEAANFFLDQTPLFLIANLQEFLDLPATRIGWWNHLQSNLKTHLSHDMMDKVS